MRVSLFDDVEGQSRDVCACFLTPAIAAAKFKAGSFYHLVIEGSTCHCIDLPRICVHRRGYGPCNHAQP